MKKTINSVNAITLRNAKRLLKDRLAKLPKNIKGKFDTENAVWQEIKSRHEFTQEDRLVMLAIMQTPFHDTGKIAGIQSYDSSASHCSFCQSMRKAKKHALSSVVMYRYAPVSELCELVH